MTQQFGSELDASINAYLQRFETKKSAILPILHAIQREKLWICDADIELLESKYNLSAIDVREVLTFYTMYSAEPRKAYRFEICNSISCWLNGSQQTLDILKKRMQSWKHDTGQEAPFEVGESACLGMCGQGPVCNVNNQHRHLRVTPEVALKLLDTYLAAQKREA